MRLFLNFIVCLLIATDAYAQALPADNTFYNPTIGTATETITPSVGTGDDSLIFTNAINAVNAAGGGKLIVDAGTYRILEVDLKSNVHIEVNSGVTLLPFNPSTSSNNGLFNADANVGIDNFSVIGVGGNFEVDISAHAPTMRLRVINFKYCSNFKVANFNITDNYTEFSSLAFGSNYTSTGTGDARRITSIRGVPDGGIIENITMINGHYGYGLVQTQAGKNLLFRNLNCTGGVTLRLETGFKLLQFTELFDFEDLKLDDIWARTIECTNGQSTLQLSPHTLDQGYFNVEGIMATSCEAGVVWSAGFTTNDQEAAGLTPGSFNTTSKIRNVTATFGQDAQLHPSKRLRWIPCQLRVERFGGVGISVGLNVDGESRTGPSIGSVMRQEDKPGHYALDFPDTEVAAIGFNIAAYYLPPRAIHRDSYDDYEVCNEAINGISFWIPADERDTPNPRNPLESIKNVGNNVDWNIASSWTTGTIPTAMDNVVLTNTVNIPDGYDAVCNNLYIPAGKLLKVLGTSSLTVSGTLKIQSESDSYGGLIVQGSVIGIIEYERHVNMAANTSTGGNDLITSPLSGQAFNDFAMANPNLKRDPNSDATLFGIFNTTTNTYETWDESSTTNLVAGTGYRTGSTDGDTFTFAGTTGNANVSIPVNTATSAWNLIGNPYPCYIKTKPILDNTNNSSIMDPINFGIYGYDGDATDGWHIINNANVTTAMRIAPGQGFFVKAQNSGNINIQKWTRTWSDVDDFIAGRSANEINNTHVKLHLSTATRSYNTNFYFKDNASLDFDLGYDSALLESVAPEFSLYSHTVQNNSGVNLAIQSLNPNDASNVAIPLGVNAESGIELRIIMQINTLPSTINVYLEDTLENTLTLLNSSDFVLTPSENLAGTGRFYLRFSSTTLSVSELDISNIQIYSNLKDKTVLVNGVLNSESQIFIYDIKGRLVLQKEINITSATNTIDVNSLNAGIYIVKLLNETQNLTKKIMVK